MRRVVGRAPGRVNLIGEHTDYNDGFVLPLALDRQVTVAAARRGDGVLRVHSSEKGARELRLVDVGPGADRDWVAYVAGAIWSLAQESVEVTGMDIALTSEVPVGSGLSSSAAVECATLLAARDLFGGPDDKAQLAAIARRVRTSPSRSRAASTSATPASRRAGTPMIRAASSHDRRRSA